MSKQYPGGFITKNFTAPTTSSAPGMWTLDQALYYTQQGVWPIPTPIDQYFNYVSLLLHGNGSASGTSNVLPFNSDASTNNFNLTINGDARPNNFTPYQGNGYYSNLFNGSTDYLTVPLAAYDFGTGAFTCEAWVYIRSVATTNMIFYGSVSGGALDELAVAVNTSQQLGWETNNSISNSGGFIPLNTWTHIALVRNGSTVTGYVNGSSVGTTTDSGAVTPTTHSLIGSYRGTILFTNGYISNARVTKSAVYTSNFTPSTTPLAAITNTSLLTCQSNRFIDNSTNAYTITPSGTAAVSPAQPFTLSSSVATYGSGYFDGTGDNLTTASNTAFAFGTGDFTIEFWAYKTANTPGSYDIAFGTGDAGTGNNGYFIELSSTRGFVFASNNSVVLSYAMNPNTSAWAHYAVTRSGSTLRLFVNGAVVTSTTYSTSLTSTVAVRVGGTGNDFFGYLADMRVVKGTAVYTTTYTLPTAPLTAISGTSLLTTQYNGAGNNNGFKDSSQNNFVVSRFGNTTQGTFTPYGSNWSNYFNGTSGQYLNAPANGAFNFGTGDFTVEGWVYPTSTSGTRPIVEIRTSAPNSTGFAFLSQSGATTLNVYTNGGFVGASTNSLTTNQWNHVALTRSGNTWTYWINGVSSGSFTNSSTQSDGATTGPKIGGSTTAGEIWVGYLSNIRINKGTALYTTGFTPSTTPLTAISGTSLLTCQSNRFIDNSTNAFAITVNGSPSVQRFSPFSPTTAYSTSVIGGSGYFDGSGDFLSAPYSASTTQWWTQDFTIEMWVYNNTNAVSGTNSLCLQLAHGVYNAASTYWAFGTNASGQVDFYYYNGAGVRLTSTSVAPLNAWNHIAMVYTNSTGGIALYLNGVSVATGTKAGTPQNSNTNTLNLGVAQSTYYNGYISNARIVNGTAVYSGSTYTVPTAPLTAITNTQFLSSFTNAGILDNAMMNDLETVGNAQISTSVKKYGTGSMYFDGTGDYLLAKSNDVFNFGTGDFTVEFWINASASGSYTQVIGTIVSSNENGTWRIGNRFNSLNQIYCARGTGSGFNEFQANVNVNDGAWHHVAVVRYSGTVTIYADGVASASSSITGTCTSANPLYVGYNGRDNAYITGYLDDVRITKGVARYTANFTPPTSQLQDQ